MRWLAWMSFYRIAICLLVLGTATTISFAQEQEQGQDQDQDQEQEQEQDDGTAQLDEAFSLKITAQTTRDLDKVVDLLEDALEKGLDEEGVESANQLLSSTLYEHAELLSKQIFNSSGRDQRWRRFRSQAITRLERAVELNPKMGQAYQLMARMHGLPAGDREAGNEAIEKAVELAGDDQVALSKALVIRATLAEDDDTMLADLAQAIKIDPENMQAIQVRGSYYLRKNEPAKAVEDFKTWLASDRENIKAYHEVARSLAGLQKLNEAIEIMDEAIKVDEESTESLLLRAQLALLAESFDRVIEDATTALKLDRKLYGARLIRARALFETGENDEALEDVNLVLDEQPEFPTALILRFEIYTEKGNYPDAIEDLKTLGDLSPTNIGYKLQLAQLYNANDQPRRAIRIYNSVLNMITTSSEGDEVRMLILRGRGDARLSLGQHKEAIEDYDKGLELGPDNDGILNNLAWVLATSPVDELRDGDRAIELATKACEVTDYKMPHILSTLASGFAENGDFVTAIDWIEKAIEVNKANAEADKDADQTPFEEQLDSLEKELASYKDEKPWRELQNVEEEKKKKADEDSDSVDSNDKESKEDVESENKKGDDKDKDKDEDDKSD